MWNNLVNSVFKKASKGKPSAVENVVRGNPVNLNLPRFGGLTTPLPVSTKLGTMPKMDTPMKMPKEIRATPTPVKKVPLSTPTPSMMPKLSQGITSPLPKFAPKAYADTKPATPTPTPDPRDNWRNMADMIIREGNKRGYDGKTIARQKANESTWGKSKFAKDRYNYGGIGAYDHDPEQAFRYDSPEDYLMGPRGYFNLIEKDPRYKQAYKNRGNPKRYAQELKKAGYASDPDYEWKMLNTQIYDPNE